MHRNGFAKGHLGILLLSYLPLATLLNPTCNPGKPGMLNVHFVCHTHDDVGWLKTVDQYYYGAKSSIQRAGVQYILDSVVSALLEDPTRKFIYVESAFFFRWWDEQTPELQEKVKMLVDEGRLEFINGGWCMNDEGAGHYNAIIDQMTLGLSKINETFGSGARPTVAWQIDPFGHSREQASLFAQMGFDGLFFGRLDHDDKSNRWANKELEMVWEASANLGKDAWLFTGVLPNGYGPPSGFCFDILCNDDPIMDDPRLREYNVDNRVDEFLRAAASQANGYATQDIIMTMGMDFHYTYAHSWYKNLDKLIKYVNARQQNGSNVNVFYSTPSCYLDALNKANMTWPTKTDDFFPYASNNHSYWTGYFTSRPTLKGFVRQSNNFLQAVKQISSLLEMGQDPRLERLKNAMGVMQHHDAITGTAKQAVTDDYYARLTEGVTESFNLVAEAYGKLQPSVPEAEAKVTPVFCPLLNESSCTLSETSPSFIVTLYNPLGKPRMRYPVRVPVPKDIAYKVTDHQGNAVASQLVPVPENVLNLPGRKSSAEFELVFIADIIPPLGFTQFFVQRTENRLFYKTQQSKIIVPQTEEELTVKFKESLLLVFDKTTHLLNAIGIEEGGEMKTLKVNQTYLWYAGMPGNNVGEKNRASGAYIFRPNGTSPFTIADKVNITIIQGDVVTEIHQTWSSWMSQVMRIYDGDLLSIEMEWLAGPIPVDDHIGKEIINRIVWGDTSTGGTFYTDSNGREILQRIKDYRETWTLNNQEPVAGNYYPVNSRLMILGKNGFMAALLSDRSQGGTSLDDGHMELMIHRRLLHDDSFGVGEALNEEAFGEGLVVRGKHHLIFSDLAPPGCDFGCLQRSLGERVMMPPIMSFMSTTLPQQTWKETYNTQWSGLQQSLPLNVHLLTLEPWLDGTLLLRLEHMYELEESNPHSKPATVDLKDMFSSLEVISAEEMNLAANQLKKDGKQYHWAVGTSHPSTNDIDSITGSRYGDAVDDGFTITLQPMEIRTFVLMVKKSTKLH
ncbi:lysosomal alpha-mannosidase-like isoform X1 [Macrobrachium nipponense]|uniref:lysosomal alpha-mannosidase-like isoform X1 n=1 Tax=Macrobrachium nipponense TaxID=159736 RepID=UPI0030C8BD04